VTYRAATPLAELTEAQFQAQVIDLAGLLGYKHYFTYRSKRSPAGWPDLALCRDRLVLVELKRERGVVSEKQKAWIGWLLEAQVETYVVRPADLDDLAAVLQARGRVFTGLAWDAQQRLVERTRAEVDA
jgi:YD repeat-containing protein